MFLAEKKFAESYKRWWNISLKLAILSIPLDLISILFNSLQMSDINTTRLPFKYPNPIPSIGEDTDITLTLGDK